MLRLNKSKDPSKIEESPLLSKVQGNTEPTAPGARQMHSTINPDRFDMTRFSERRDEEESSFKIILYVVVVIVIGVGLALLVRNLITNQNSGGDDDTDQTEDELTDPSLDSNIVINTTTREDPVDAPLNSELRESLNVALGSSTVSPESITLSSISYDRFQTFSRLEFELDGVTAANQLPTINLNYDKTNNTLSLVLPEGMQIEDDLRSSIQVGDLVTSIAFDSSTTTYTISVSQEFKYKLTPTVGGLTIDIRTTQQIASIENSEGTPNETDTTPEEETPDTTPDTTPNQNQQPPAGNSFDNQFSQQKQFVTSSITGNTLEMTETYYEDAVEYFELAFGRPNHVGNSYVPNSEVELIEESGVPYLKWTIKNLQRIEFGEINEGNIGISLASANFVNAKLESFANGTAVIKVRLRNKADFRLVSEPTISGLTQVISLQIKD